MLIIKKRNIQKGFSLIELMVAVVILAIAVLGIYQAYSVSFTGMADARDRTVATNYVRQAMEGIKNMDFDKIRTQSRSYITGTKYEYEREVIVQESTNLKKIITKVFWRNRNGNKKMVETGMSVHFMQTSEGTATRIMLIANPYNVLTGGTSTITAVAKDGKGNTVTIWTGDISFSIDTANSTTSGTFSNKSGIIKGKVTIDFTAENTEGTVTIVASTSELSSDSIEMKVTVPKKPVKINLTANPTYMTADINSTSEITATIVDADGETAIKATNVITFSVSGPGTLSAITSIAPINCIARITLTSNGTPETITVTASATGLEPGVVNVFTGGQISLSASRFSVPNNETSKVTVTTKDVDGVPINYIGYINLEISPNPDGSGIFENNLTTIEIYFNGSTSSKTVTFTGASEGIVNINAEDQAGILVEGSIELTITEELVPHHIAVTANPSIIDAGGTETSTITAEIKTEYNITITGYTDLITFNTDFGTFPDGSKMIDTNNSNVTYENGVATVELFPPTVRGTTTITVSSTYNTNDIYGSTKVEFYTEPDHIVLVASCLNIYAGGETSTITATIVDASGIIVLDCCGVVEFSIIGGTDYGKFFDGSTVKTVTIENGIAEVILKSTNVPGIVTVEAEVSSLPDPSETINITVEEVPLKLVVGSVSYTPDPNIITFNIKIDDSSLTLNSMKVEWIRQPSGKLEKIEIKSPSTAEDYDPIINTGNGSSPCTEDNINKDLLLGESTIRLTFTKNMIGVSVEVIFYTDLGDFSIAF